MKQSWRNRLKPKIVRRSVESSYTSSRYGLPIELHFGKNFKAHVAKAFRNRWVRIDDLVGLVNTNPIPIIEQAVKSKSKRLSKYQEAVGEDVRLILVANRISNSGKLKLVGESMISMCGFGTVYFFSYPENVTVFE